VFMTSKVLTPDVDLRHSLVLIELKHNMHENIELKHNQVGLSFSCAPWTEKKNLNVDESN